MYVVRVVVVLMLMSVIVCGFVGSGSSGFIN